MALPEQCVLALGQLGQHPAHPVLVVLVAVVHRLESSRVNGYCYIYYISRQALNVSMLQPLTCVVNTVRVVSGSMVSCQLCCWPAVIPPC